MTDAQQVAIDRLDKQFGGHDFLLDDMWKRSDGQPPAIEGWFGKPDVMGTIKPIIFIHIEPDGSTHS